MSLGLIGRKCGMTRVFTEDGVSIPVSVIEVTANRIVQVKTEAGADGYNAVQVTTGSKKAKHLNKCEANHFAQAKVDAGRGLWEFRLPDATMLDSTKENSLKVGDEITVELFKQGQIVDVTGISKGKGFAGVIKRHNFSSQDATHGNSLSHRAPGSIGQNQSPGRVFKGKKMAGQLGNCRSTVQNLEIVRVDAEKKLLLIKGSIPGSPGGNVVIRLAIKKQTSGGEKCN